MACNCTDFDSGQLSEYGINHSGITHLDKEEPKSNIPCGCCRSCKKIQSGSHPDVLSIKPTGSFIKIDQIRDLYQTLTMKPYEARYRMVIMTDAQCMNSAASNSFLKILEEPPDQTILILIAEKKTDLLQTVISRCQHIRFKPISRNVLAAMLVKNGIKNSKDAFVLATMAKGSFAKALTMRRTDWMGRRNWLIKTIGLDQHGPTMTKPAGVLFSVSTQLLENRDTLEDCLETIKSWLRDLIIFKYQPDKIIHQDLMDKIKNVSNKFTIKSLFHKIEAVQSTQLSIQRSNTNVKLALDLLMLKLTETKN
jgi:DNA polymerase-3 subunit delta'